MGRRMGQAPTATKASGWRSPRSVAVAGGRRTVIRQTAHVAAWETLSDALRSGTRYLMEGQAAIEEATAKAAALEKVLGAKTAEKILARGMPEQFARRLL